LTLLPSWSASRGARGWRRRAGGATHQPPRGPCASGW
jgi:hypothetical protein